MHYHTVALPFEVSTRVTFWLFVFINVNYCYIATLYMSVVYETIINVPSVFLSVQQFNSSFQLFENTFVVFTDQFFFLQLNR